MFQISQRISKSLQIIANYQWFVPRFIEKRAQPPRARHRQGHGTVLACRELPQLILLAKWLRSWTPLNLKWTLKISILSFLGIQKTPFLWGTVLTLLAPRAGFEIRNKPKGSPGPLPLKLWGSSLILKGPKTTRHVLLFLFTKFIV